MSLVGDKSNPVHYDRHTPEYRTELVNIKNDLQARCPLAFSETYGGHWVVSGYDDVFELARMSDLLSHEHDIEGTARGYQGISIPASAPVRSGFLELDPPEQKDFRHALNPYLSPAAVERWQPMVEDMTRACLDEKIATGRIDFVDDLANVVPAIMTLAMMGLPLSDWEIYNYPTHAIMYTKSDSPDKPRVVELYMDMHRRLGESVADRRINPRPGMVNALIEAKVCGQPLSDASIVETLGLLVGGGFDTTTALTAHSLEWLGEHPDQRDRLRTEFDDLIDTATEEFLRFYAPAPGDGRTITRDYEHKGYQLLEGDRIYVSWTLANRDPKMFPNPDVIVLDRSPNRHTSFGLGVHRCIGSNVARSVFKIMMRAVLERMPDYVCDPEGTVYYDTIGVINGMKNLPATFTPGQPIGQGINETIAKWQAVLDTTDLADAVTAATN